MIQRLQKIDISILLIFFISILIFLAMSQDVFAAPEENISSKLINQFMDEASTWAKKLEGSVLYLFKLLFTLEIAMLGITGIMKRQSLEDLLSGMCMSVFFGGFILACILNYQEWSLAIVGGLSRLTTDLGYDKFLMEGPMSVGFEIFQKVAQKTSMWEPFNAICFIFFGLIILMCFALTTIQIIFIKCEAFITIGAGFVLLGFGGCSMFKEYAINLMKYILAVGFKLYVLNVVLGLGYALLIRNIEISDYLDLLELGHIIVTSLLLYILSKSLPDVAAGIIQGAHVNSSSSAAAGIMRVVGGAAAGAGVAAVTKGVGGANALRKATQLASGQGGNMLGNIAKNLAGTGMEAWKDRGNKGMVGEISSRLSDKLAEQQSALMVDQTGSASSGGTEGSSGASGSSGSNTGSTGNFGANSASMAPASASSPSSSSSPNSSSGASPAPRSPHNADSFGWDGAPSQAQSQAKDNSETFGWNGGSTDANPTFYNNFGWKGGDGVPKADNGNSAFGWKG